MTILLLEVLEKWIRQKGKEDFFIVITIFFFFFLKERLREWQAGVFPNSTANHTIVCLSLNGILDTFQRTKSLEPKDKEKQFQKHRHAMHRGTAIRVNNKNNNEETHKCILVRLSTWKVGPDITVTSDLINRIWHKILCGQRHLESTQMNMSATITESPGAFCQFSFSLPTPTGPNLSHMFS